MARSSMTPRDLADLLLQKAREDAYAMRSVGNDPKTADWIVGFHAQQAVEKALKAVLTALSVRYGRTHSLDGLVELLANTRAEVPAWTSGVTSLTPFGATLRYAELDVDQPLDREATFPLVERVVEWATHQVDAIGSS
jgi:HEPN domain-containing protein